MKATSEQIMNGLIRFADSEVMNNLPTSGKWLVGTGLGVATTKAHELIHAIEENSLVKTMNIVDSNGMFDVDLILDNLKASATKYGKMSISIPIVGTITFSDADVDSLKNCIERC